MSLSHAPYVLWHASWSRTYPNIDEILNMHITICIVSRQNLLFQKKKVFMCRHVWKIFKHLYVVGVRFFQKIFAFSSQLYSTFILQVD